MNIESIKVPFVDLKRVNSEALPEIEKKIHEIIDTSGFILGKNVKAFEQNFASFCGSKFCLGVSNGTVALELALKALGIGQGDEVITVPNSFFATSEAISLTGARPVFVDIEPEAYTIDISKLEKAVTKKTKAILPVNLYGQMSDIKILSEIAKKHGLFVVDDCAQSHGALYDGKKSGSFGDISCFSFYPTKNLGAFGEAGAVTTDSKEISGKLSLLRGHGEYPKNTHSLVGTNYRLEEIQGAVLDTKLKFLDKWNEGRRKAAKIYFELLENVKWLSLPVEKEKRKHVYHLFVIRAKNRDKLRQHLEQKGISTAIHYPTPIHLQPAYAHLGYKQGSFPVCEKIVTELVSLPIFYGIKQEEIEKVSLEIERFYS